MSSTNNYVVYMLRVLACQGALASIFTDPNDPESFSAGFIEAADHDHMLMCDLTPWGQIDGWRVRRNSDILQVLCGEEYEQRLAMLLEYYKVRHRPFFTEPPQEDTDLLVSVLLECRDKKLLVSIVQKTEMVTGYVREVNGLRCKLCLLDFYGREAEEEVFTLREIEMLEIDTPEERMYRVLGEITERENLTLVSPEET